MLSRDLILLRRSRCIQVVDILTNLQAGIRFKGLAFAIAKNLYKDTDRQRGIYLDLQILICNVRDCRKKEDTAVLCEFLSHES